MKIKKSDLLIVSYLRKDARMKLTEMSKATKIPVSTLFDKIMTYKHNGLIRKTTSLVRFERFGYQAKALIVFSASKKKDRQRLFELLDTDTNVNSLFKINNGWDFMAEVICPGVKEVEGFVESMEEKVSLRNKIFYIIEELRREEFFANPQKLRLLWGDGK